MNAEVVELEENTRDGISSRESKEVLGFVQDMIRKKIHPVQFKNSQKRDMSSYYISCVC